MDTKEIIYLALAGITISGTIIAIYRSYSDPSQRQDKEIAVGEVACKLRHEGIDKSLINIESKLTLVQENHLKHIEERLNGLENNQMKIFTILEERLPRK